MNMPEKPKETPEKPNETFWAAVLELSKGTVDRSRSGAEFVEKAAAAVATVYTGTLALAFSVSDNPLPLRGLIPAVFLGLAIAGAAYYLAYPSQSVSSLETPDDGGSLEEWTNTFTEVTRRMASKRGWALRAGIFSLAFGAFFLPTPFLKVKTAPPKPAAEIRWPALPSANLPLQRILFREQVKEAGRLRREERSARAGRRRAPVAWPSVPSANPPLERILFTEQVKEVSRLRKEAKPAPVGQWKVREPYVWWAFAAGLFIVALTAIVTRIRDWWAERPPADRGDVDVPMQAR